MKMTYRMTDIDCANCAAKMEQQIKKIDGVKAVSIGFITQKITIEADDNVFEAVLEKAKEICKKIHRGTQIITE